MNACAPFDALFEPSGRCLTPEAAERIATMCPDAATSARVAELAEKANEGQLSAEERREYESCVRAGTVLSILQAKARQYLKRQQVAG